MSKWAVGKLGDFVQIGSSKRIFYKEYVAQGIPFYRSKEVIERHNGNQVSTDLFITEDRYNEIKNKYGAPRPGDILLTSVGTLGVPWLIDDSQEFYFKDGNLTWFSNFDQDLSNKYLYYWLISPIGRYELEMSSIGSTQPALTIRGLKNLDISVPPLQEQHAISAVLSSLDDKIDLLHRQNKTLEALAQTLFRHWFIDGAEDDWEEKSLQDVVDIAIGRTPPRKEFQWFSTDPIDTKWVSIKDLGNEGIFIFDTSEYLTKEAIDRFRIPMIPQDTVVLSFKMTIGRVGITVEEMTSNEAIAHFKFRSDTPFIKEYLYFFLKLFKYQELGSTSSIVTSINSRMIKEMEITIPDTRTMERFADLSQRLFDKIKENQSQIGILKKLSDTLLPKLISGEVRVQL